MYCREIESELIGLREKAMGRKASIDLDSSQELAKLVFTIHSSIIMYFIDI